MFNSILGFIMVATLIITVVTGYMLHKIKKDISLCVGAFLVEIIFLFPFFLNTIITQKWYVWWPFDSSIDEKEWFAFLGSYIGAIGTIMCGWIAYRQNKLMQEQQKISEKQAVQINSLQAVINKYQLKPSPYFGEIAYEFYFDSEVAFKQQDQKRELYYRVCGKDIPEDIKNLLVLNINVKDRDIIPIMKYNIQHIEWRIANNIYTIILSEEKRVKDLYLKSIDKIALFIDDQDTVGAEGNQSITEFFTHLRIHQKYSSYPKVNYDSSELKITFEFENQACETNKYMVVYRFTSGIGEMESVLAHCEQKL